MPADIVPMGEYDTKRTKTAPTAGPTESDRFGRDRVAQDLRARIIKIDIEGGMPRIAIASGTEHGTRTNMTGYIRAGVDGVLAEFQIIEAKPRVSYACLPDVTREDLSGASQVVINPTSRPPQPAANITTRIIHLEAIPLGTRITLPRGSAHGITVGTPGELRSKEGRGAFLVSSCQLLRCQAVVHEPVDFVATHPEAILHRLPPKLRGAAVQRKATATPTTDDTQAVARAGVEGADSPLPFADVIQRAFGKHDISSIRTRIGGPAAAATQALGARAYAMGNTVAFGSAPDLHTAAHEAAHVVQQARGAVAVQGLGTADDAHERQADEVADAVVAGRSAEPLLDDLGRGSPSTSAVQRAPLPPRGKQPGIAELHAARRAAKLVEQLAITLPHKLQLLQVAREQANPDAMRIRAGEVMIARGLLEMSSITMQQGLPAAAGGDRASLEASLEKARGWIPQLPEPGERALAQARALAQVQSGSLSELPREDTPSAPDETRRRAASLSPLGLCDDPTMQHATSHACPLDVKQREAVRADVSRAIGQVARNWTEAASDTQLEERLKPLFASTGLDPFTNILLTAIEWFGPKVSAKLRQRQAIAASETFEQLVEVAAQKAAPTEGDKLLFGFYKKLSSTVLARTTDKRPKNQALFDAMRDVQGDWERVASQDVRQLPDPALVALGEGLQTAPYSVPFFREKLVRLVANHNDILKIGKHLSPEQPERSPLVAVRVRHPLGHERLALARPTTRPVAIHVPHQGHEPGEDSRLVKDGNYTFHDWIDQSLVSLVPLGESAPVLASNDARWRTEARQETPKEVARWHEAPTETNDVKMLAVPKNPFVPRGQR